MDRLRAPDGCPWDREQTLETLAPYLLEEAHEVAEAVAAGDPRALAEELGDLLLQIVFMARIGRENGWFDLDDVARDARAASERAQQQAAEWSAGAEAAREPGGRAKAVLGTNADKPLLKRIGQYLVPVYDYCLVTEPLSSEQIDRTGWRHRQGLFDITN